MALLSIAQIYNAARQAGFAPHKAVIATAIALAESSGGDPNAQCLDCFPGVTEDSRGLWQINVDAHPQYADWNLFDPATNARAAYAVSDGGRNFNPWSTWGTTLSGHTGSANAELPKVYKALGIKHGAKPPDTAAGGDLPQSDDGSGTSSGTADATTASFLGLNPFGGLGGDLARISIIGAFTLGGIGLAVLGLYKGVQPAAQQVKDKAAGAATTIAKVAAV